MTNKIDTETLIDAPKSTVWDIVTKPEHIAEWFGCDAQFELKPGAKGMMIWKDYGQSSITVVDVDEPHLFSFLWRSPDEEMQRSTGETLVSFAISEVNGMTRLLLTESGFDEIGASVEDRNALHAKHSEGWVTFINQINAASTKL